MIALGYYMATEMFGTFKALTIMTSPFIILFLTVVVPIYSSEVPCH